MDADHKRIFFGLEVRAPWPDQFPQGGLIQAEGRHATLAFLGEVPYRPLIQQLDRPFSELKLKVGLVGTFLQTLFLPSGHPRVVAWEVHWNEDSHALVEYREFLLRWLRALDYHPKEHEGPWLCHVTISRKPFNHSEWKKFFNPLPMAIFGIHLYESLGSCIYRPLWSQPLIPPFEEIEHTADIAYLINGENLTQLHRHAQTALAFRYPALLPYLHEDSFTHLDEIIIALNQMIAEADRDVGCPFKAVSFHGNITVNKSILQWEMIVDV